MDLVTYLASLPGRHLNTVYGLPEIWHSPPNSIYTQQLCVRVQTMQPHDAAALQKASYPLHPDVRVWAEASLTYYGEVAALPTVCIRIRQQPVGHTGRGDSSAGLQRPAYLYPHTASSSEATCLTEGARSQAGLKQPTRPLYSFIHSAMTDLRGQFPDIFQAHQTVQQIMWQPNLLQVANFLDAGMKRLHTVDPNEGSNI